MFFLGFCTSRAYAKSKPAGAQNLGKIAVRGSQNLPGWLPNPPKSSPERSRRHKNRIKTPTSSQETRKKGPRAPKKHPRAQNSANMPPREMRKLRGAGGPAPPLGTYNRYFQQYIRLLDLTRLGTDSGAADFGSLSLPKGSKILKNLDLRSK